MRNRGILHKIGKTWRAGTTAAIVSTLLSLTFAFPPAAHADLFCTGITFRGESGEIHINSDGRTVPWGITMHDMSESVGRWDVDTFGGNKKLSSSFHRTTTTPYVPHGHIDIGTDRDKIRGGNMVRAGTTFQVRGILVSHTGRSYSTVSNKCVAP